MRALPAALLLAAAALAAAEAHPGDYHQGIQYDWDTARLDVMVVPHLSPSLAEAAAVAKAVPAWKNAALAYGSPAFSSTFDLRIVAPGSTHDVEILVLTGAVNPVLMAGLGIQTPIGPCKVGGAIHHDEGSPWSSAFATCAERKVCLVVATGFLLGGANRMYDLTAHELGHCLGLAHLTGTVPPNDIMAHRSDPSQVGCVSNLNVRGLEAIFLWRQPPGSEVTMSPLHYSPSWCPGP